MTDYLTVVRDGRLRLYSVNGKGAEEVATAVLGDAMPSDAELAEYSAVLIRITGERASPAPVERKAPRAKRTTRPAVPMSKIVTELMADGNYWTCRQLEIRLPEGSKYSTLTSTLSQMTAKGELEANNERPKGYRLPLAEPES